MRLSRAEAKKIMESPPTVLQTALWETPVSWVEFQKITGPGGLPERWRQRTYTIHGVSQWEHAG